MLEFFVLYMGCHEYGRSRCVEAAEIFAKASSSEEAHAQLAEIGKNCARCNVVDIEAYRS